MPYFGTVAIPFVTDGYAKEALDKIGEATRGHLEKMKVVGHFQNCSIGTALIYDRAGEAYEAYATKIPVTLRFDGPDVAFVLHGIVEVPFSSILSARDLAESCKDKEEMRDNPRVYLIELLRRIEHGVGTTITTTQAAIWREMLEKENHLLDRIKFLIEEDHGMDDGDVYGELLKCAYLISTGGESDGM